MKYEKVIEDVMVDMSADFPQQDVMSRAAELHKAGAPQEAINSYLKFYGPILAAKEKAGASAVSKQTPFQKKVGESCAVWEAVIISFVGFLPIYQAGKFIVVSWLLPWRGGIAMIRR